jgi:hypothetical protein
MIVAPSRRVIFVLATLFTVACGDNLSPPDEQEEEEEVPGSAFAVGTRIWDDASTTSYFHVVRSLEAGTVVDLGEAVEVSGAAKLFSIGKLGWFAIGGGESPTISRYELDADDRLQPRETISLQSYGVSSLWDTVYVVSPTKAYYPDRDNQQLIVWNPTEMTVSGSIALPQTNRDGFLSLYSYTPIVRGNELLFTVGWFDWVTNDAVRAETGLVVIDTDTNQVVRFDVDTRCGGITTGVETSSGDMYLVSSALAGAAYKLGRLTSKPCVLRIRGNETTFDAGYHVQLDTLTSGALAGEPVSGGGDRIFLRVFDEAAAELPAQPATWDVTGQLAWNWWRWDVATNAMTQVTALPPSTADVLWFEIGERVYGAQTTADYSTTTLIDLTATDGPAPALTAVGFIHGVAQIR